MSDLEGFDQLAKQLAALGDINGAKALRNALTTAATIVVKDAKANIPKSNAPHKTHKGRIVAPGFASRSIIKRSELSRDKKTATIKIGVKKEAFYALQFIELGTRFIPATPWLTRALERNQNAVIIKLGDKIKSNINKAAKKK